MFNEGVYSREGEDRIVTFDNLHTELRFSRISAAREEIRGWLQVNTAWPTAPAKLYDGTFNLSGPNARRDMAKYLSERCPDIGGWANVLEQSCVLVFEDLREGTPIYITGTGPKREGHRYRAEPFFLERLPSIMFGPGGSGKSLLLATLAVAIHGGWQIAGLDIKPGPFLYCDWEMDQETWDETVRMICKGNSIDEMPPIYYRSCSLPLHQEAESIGRFVAREGVVAVGIDSLGFACGGDKTSQEVVMRMFSAMRPWGVSTLSLDHIAKGDDATTPFGSVYTINAARSVWRARGHQEPGSLELSMALTQTKTNFGKLPPLAFKFTFDDLATPEAVYCERIDPKKLPIEIAPSDIVSQAKEFLEQYGEATAEEIGKQLGRHRSDVSRTLNKASGFHRERRGRNIFYSVLSLRAVSDA